MDDGTHFSLIHRCEIHFLTTAPEMVPVLAHLTNGRGVHNGGHDVDALHKHLIVEHVVAELDFLEIFPHF